MYKSRADEKQSVQVLEDNRLNEADIPEVFYSSVYMPHSHHNAALRTKFNFTALLIKTSQHKAAGARSQSYLLHSTSDTDYWSLLTDEK